MDSLDSLMALRKRYGGRGGDSGQSTVPSLQKNRVQGSSRATGANGRTDWASKYGGRR